MKVDSLAFGLYSIDKRNWYGKDSFGKDYFWLSSYMGQGWMHYDILPKGNYILKGRGGSARQAGNMPFAFSTFGEKQALSIK
jgi:hypothetical protein